MKLAGSMVMTQRWLMRFLLMETVSPHDVLIHRHQPDIGARRWPHGTA
jgi:hypothetical protein